MVDVAGPARGLSVRAAGAVAALGALVWALSTQRWAAIGSAVAAAQPGWLAAAVAATAVSLVAAARNLTAFAPLRLPAIRSLHAQLAVCGLRVITPAAVSTPAVCARYLNRSGLPAAESLAVVAVAQTAQLLMTIVVVGGLAAFGVGDVPLPDPARVGLWAAAAAAVLIVAVVVGRRAPAVRRGLAALRRGVAEVAAHARRQPLRIASGLGASAALTLAHVTAFASCLAAVGGHVPILTLTAIYLAGAGAGSLVPTPAGVGPVEVTMVGGLIAAGVAGDTAAAAVLLTRVITVWLLAPPGWLAVRSLRRRRLL